jgi:hypothetical protein
MRNLHDRVSALAVCRSDKRGYPCGMKPDPHRNSDTNHVVESTDPHTRSVRERGMHATNARPPPAVPYRRYPSLSDDGQPYFPRFRRARRSVGETMTVAEAVGSGSSPLLSIRVIAWAAIIVIIAVLVANA